MAAQASLAAHARASSGSTTTSCSPIRASWSGRARAGGQDVGLNVGEFKKALDDKKFRPAVDADMKLGEEVAVEGTPTMFVNGQRVADPTDFAAVSS